MQGIIQETIKSVLDFREWFLDFFGPALPWLEAISLLISGVLLWLIIFTILQTGYINRRVENFMDWAGVGNVGRRRQLRAWQKILERVKTKETASWKIAVLEADKIFDDILKASGYLGKTADERIQQVKPEALASIEKAKEAHRVARRIAQEPDFAITYPQIIDVLKVYKQVFLELNLLD